METRGSATSSPWLIVRAVVPLHHEARVRRGLETGTEPVALAEVRALPDPERLGGDRREVGRLLDLARLARHARLQPRPDAPEGLGPQHAVVVEGPPPRVHKDGLGPDQAHVAAGVGTLRPAGQQLPVLEPVVVDPHHLVELGRAAGHRHVAPDEQVGVLRHRLHQQAVAQVEDERVAAAPDRLRVVVVEHQLLVAVAVGVDRVEHVGGDRGPDLHDAVRLLPRAAERRLQPVATVELLGGLAAEGDLLLLAVTVEVEARGPVGVVGLPAAADVGGQLDPRLVRPGRDVVGARVAGEALEDDAEDEQDDCGSGEQDPRRLPARSQLHDRGQRSEVLGLHQLGASGQGGAEPLLDVGLHLGRGRHRSSFPELDPAVSAWPSPARPARGWRSTSRCPG